MKRFFPRVFILLILLWPTVSMTAEKVADLPIPTKYVNDFAQVLSPAVTQQMEDLATATHNQAAAELFIVTIKSLDDGQSIEDFTQALVMKWKIGKAGQDRSALMLLVLNPHGLRIETGYGLEGLFNDAKVGAILDQAKPFAASGNYDQAMLTEEQALAAGIGTDKGVSITPGHAYVSSRGCATEAGRWADRAWHWVCAAVDLPGRDRTAGLGVAAAEPVYRQRRWWRRAR